MSWADSTPQEAVGQAQTKTLTIVEATGWDVEPRLLEAFLNLFEMPAYANHVHKLVAANGPAGAYHLTCQNCHMDAILSTTLVCECQGLEGTYDRTTLQNAESCQHIENMNGELKCGDHQNIGGGPGGGS